MLLFILAQHKLKCKEHYFACPNGRCIPAFWICDKEEDCEDGADESHCGISPFIPVIFLSV